MSRRRSTALTRVAKLSSVSTILAACLDTSEPLPMATPTSACLRAAASLTASPVIATTWPSCCMSLARRSLSSGATRPNTCSWGSRLRTSSSLRCCNSVPVITPGPRPSSSAMARAVTVWSPVIIRTSTPAPSAVWTASLAAARSGSMIPTSATMTRSVTAGIGSASAAVIASSSRSRAANASTRSPRSDSWLYAESNGTSARRDSDSRFCSASTPIFAASPTNAASVGSPMTDPSSPTVASVQSTRPSARRWKSGGFVPHVTRIEPAFWYAGPSILNQSPPASIVVAVIAFIVSVPVLSELMTVVPPRVSTSVSDLTTALDSARRRAPDDSMAWTNVGRPVGMDAIAVEMHSSTSVEVSWPRTMPKMAITAEPRVTCVFWNTRFVRSPSAISPSGRATRSLAIGALSPVSAASCTSSVAEERILPSAGTTSPASSSTTSPGTSLVDSTSSTRPDRRTRARGTWSLASASTLARAFISWFVPMTTLNITSPSTTRPVATCAMAKLATQTISSMMFIGLDSWARATAQMLGGGSVGSSFGPYWASRRWTSSLASPRSGSTPIRPAASSADRLYQAASWAGCSTVVISAPECLVPDLDVARRAAARPAGADSFPPQVEADAERENGQQRDDRGRLVDQGREHERHQDHRGRPDREREDQCVGAGLGPDPEVGRGDEREDHQGDSAADRGDRVQLERHGEDQARDRLEQQ